MAAVYTKPPLPAALKASLPSLSLSQDDLNMLMEDETEVDLSRTGTSARASPDHLKHSLPLPDTVFHRSAPARTSSPAPDNAVMAELEVQKVKAEYLARLNGLEDRLAEAMRQKHELQAKLDVASRGNEEGSRGKLLHSIALPDMVMRADVEDLKHSLGNLRVTDLQYVELQSIPEVKRSLTDEVRIKFYEATHDVLNELKMLKRRHDVDQRTGEDARQLRDRIETLQRELDARDAALSTAKVEHMKMAKEYQAITDKLQALRADTAAVEETRAQIKSLQEQLQQQTEDVKQWKLRHNEAEAYGKSVERGRDEQKRQIELLELDKVYLEKEATTVGERVRSLEEKLAQRSSELESLKENQLGHVQAVLQTTEKQRQEYETRLQDELSTIRLRTTADLDEIRKNTKEMFEREIDALKESLASVREENGRAERALEQTRKAYTDLLTQYGDVSHRFNNEKARLEAELATATQQAKVKSFESDRLRVVYEETLGSMRRLQIDNEKYLKKVDVLTKEYHELRSESANKLAQLESSNAFRAGRGNGDRVTRSGTLIELDENVRLAAEVARSQKLEEELQAKNRQLGALEQPQSFLVDHLNDKENRYYELSANYARLEQHTANLIEEKKALLKERNILLEDVRQLVANRKQMESLRKVVTQMHRSISAASQ